MAKPSIILTCIFSKRLFSRIFFGFDIYFHQHFSKIRLRWQWKFALNNQTFNISSNKNNFHLPSRFIRVNLLFKKTKQSTRKFGLSWNQSQSRFNKIYYLIIATSGFRLVWLSRRLRVAVTKKYFKKNFFEFQLPR